MPSTESSRHGCSRLTGALCASFCPAVALRYGTISKFRFGGGVLPCALFFPVLEIFLVPVSSSSPLPCRNTSTCWPEPTPGVSDWSYLTILATGLPLVGAKSGIGDRLQHKSPVAAVPTWLCLLRPFHFRPVPYSKSITPPKRSCWDRRVVVPSPLCILACSSFGRGPCQVARPQEPQRRATARWFCCTLLVSSQCTTCFMQSFAPSGGPLTRYMSPWW